VGATAKPREPTDREDLMLKTAERHTAYADFVLQTRHGDIPEAVRERAKDYILDLIGVGAGAHHLPAANICRETGLRQFGVGDGATPARVLFDGRAASGSGAALIAATQIDSLDAHDGYSLSKGHAGCGLLPGILAFAEAHPDLTGEDMLTAVVLGYEIACRAAVSLHATVPDYHTSGAWVALAVAALGVRIDGGDTNHVRQAVGIAEYHGPRSQMMREIDNPTMLHDGSGWGSMVGVVSADLALSGFEGAPAITIEDEAAAPYWSDLGTRWLTLEQNIKLFPVCRWGHAPIQAALNVRRAHGLTADDIESVEIYGFHEATRLAHDMPETTGKAQYSIDYPVAAALLDGELTAKHVSGETFAHPEITRLVDATSVSECDECNANFPQDRLGRTVVVTKDNRRLDSGIVRAPGEHTEPIDRQGIIDKYRTFSTPNLGAERSREIEEAVYAMDAPDRLARSLTDLLYQPIG